MRIGGGGLGGWKPPPRLFFPCGVGDLTVEQCGLVRDGIHPEFLELELGHHGFQFEEGPLQGAVGAAECDAQLG